MEEKIDALLKSVSEMKKSIDDFDKKVSNFENELKRSHKDLDEKINTLDVKLNKKIELMINEAANDISISVSMDLQEKLDANIENIDKKIKEEVGNVEVSAHMGSILKKVHSTTEGLARWERGIFIPSLGQQLPAIDSEAFKAHFRGGKLNDLSNFDIADATLQFLRQTLTANIEKKSLLKSILDERIFIDSCYVFGNNSKHLTIQFSSASIAHQVRSFLAEYNKRQNSAKKPSLRFSHMRTGVDSIDSGITVGTKILHTAKKTNLISSYALSPRLGYEKTGMTISTRVRRTGQTTWTPVNWCTQSLNQAKTDFIKSLQNPDPDDLKQFIKLVSEISDHAGENPRERRKK